MNQFYSTMQYYPAIKGMLHLAYVSYEVHMHYDKWKKPESKVTYYTIPSMTSWKRQI